MNSDFSLRTSLGSTLPEEPSREEVTSWFADAPGFTVNGSVLEELLAKVPPAKLYDRAPVIAQLRAAAETGRPLSFNALWRERQGGRRYAFAVPGYTGPLILSHGENERLAPVPGRALLQAIPRVLRPALSAPGGCSLIVADISACFLAIAAGVTRDAALCEDMAADPHARVGQHLAPGAPDPRAVGKVINNALVGGMTPYGLRDALVEHGFPATADDAKAMYTAWWSRYPTFGGFLHWFEKLLQDRIRNKAGLGIEAPNGRMYSFSPAEVAGWQPREERDYPHAYRSIVSSLWRAVEGSILDRAVQLLHSERGSLRLVLTTYDGLLLAAPAGAEEHGIALVRWAFERALWETRVNATVKVEARATWQIAVEYEPLGVDTTKKRR